MKGQTYIRFPKEVTQFMTGDPTAEEETVLPMFRELGPEEEAAFRRNARDNYRPGDPIDELFHPIWRDEAERMNEEDKELGRVGICPKCNGTQMRVIPAKNDVPPDNALGAILKFKAVLSWIVWCDCKDGWTWFLPVENGSGSTRDF